MRQHNLIWASSPDRGLETLLDMWGDIRRVYPDAELHVAYGFKVFDMIYADNPERQNWKQMIIDKMKQPGITYHNRLGKKELHELRLKCGIWAYPTWFSEINCITALEMQFDGVVPCVMNVAALKETVQAGIKVDGDIGDDEIKREYIGQLIFLMDDTVKWKKEQKKGINFAKNYSWDLIAKKWDSEFKRPKLKTKLTVYTPTIRKGFWYAMAGNLASQTYKNFEWIIIDDFKEDRSKLAEKIAKDYGIEIRYIRGRKHKKNRTYGLVRANNTCLEEANGELMVFLQDFVFLPPDGLEQFATLHEQHPDSLIATPDMYVASKVKPNIESEDWFNGEVDIFGTFIRKNVRIQNKGLRETVNPYDFEQNYGAIPVKIARELGGWYEFYDEGLGYDNTDIAYRALQSGYKILLDEMNVGVCVDHWEPLSGTRENVIGRARKLNDPRYVWMTEMVKAGKLPLVRTEDIDFKIDLFYEIPKEVPDLDVVKWLNVNSPLIVKRWLEEVKL